MSYRITPQPGYLRADLFSRETARQTREFLEALTEAARQHRVTRILINVQSSRPIFKVEQYSASSYLKELAQRPWLRVALVAGHADVRSAHEYVALLAGQQGASLRSFADTASAMAWLQAVAPTGSEAQSQEKR